MSLKIAVLSLMITFVIANNKNYCDKKFQCGKDKNIGCENKHLKNKWGDNCGDPKLTAMVTGIQQLLVEYHNKQRNLVATGQLPPYKAAARMSVMKWDEELAYLAELNVRSCKYGHDACHNTENYKIAGQNIAMSMTSEHKLVKDANMAVSLAESWFDEYKNGHWNANPTGVIGHFTQFVRAEAKALGCAMATYIEKGDKEWRKTYLVCNYSFGNLGGYVNPYAEVDKETDAGSKCTSGKDGKYPVLCGPNEVY